MKKSVLIAIMGLAAGVLSSYAQGTMSFNSYFAGPTSTGYKIFNVDGITPLTGSAFTASLVWSLSPITEATGSGSLNPAFNSTTTAPSTGLVTSPFSTIHPGYFENASQNFTLSPYTAGTTVYFEVLAYNGGNYANSTIRAHSAAFSYTLATGLATPGMPVISSFSVAPVGVPEPATLALAGLGGLASLVMLRRKKA
jgi:hypothetical protein